MEKFILDFYKWEKVKANDPFLMQPFGDKWETTTYADAGQQARKMAAGLRSLGFPPKSHIGLVSKNCREWIIADLAIMMAGYVSVPFFPTLTSEQISTVLKLGDVKALFVGKMEVWDEMKNGVPADMPIIAMPHYADNSKITEGQQWDDIMAKHQPLTDDEISELYMDDIWTIVYTSGTTGTPKGVVLDYRIYDSARLPTEASNPLKIDLKGNNRFFSYLPLNHIAERVVIEGSVLRYGGVIAFAESLDTFVKNLSDIKPTMFFGVPRIYAKFQQGILAKMPQEKLNKLLKIPFLSGFIKKKIRKGLGLNESRVFVSGAAPLPEPLKQWFAKLNINIYNGYGMTENCAICTFLEPSVSKPGAVGQPQVGVKLKIHEETGEILVQSPYNMRGYYKEPEKTAEVLKDGWLHTGDQGRIDEDGDLWITGRVKDTFKTTKGKYIIPGPIEWGFGTNTDVEQICLLGLGCDQPIALVNLSENAAKKPKQEVTANLEATRKTINQERPNYQKISTIVVTKEPWTVENGLLTPTLKVKRNVMDQKYKEDLQRWQADNNTVIFE